MFSAKTFCDMAMARIDGESVAGNALVVYAKTVGVAQSFARANDEVVTTTACEVVALTVRARSEPLLRRAKLEPPPRKGSTRIVFTVVAAIEHISVHAAFTDTANDVVVATQA